MEDNGGVGNNGVTTALRTAKGDEVVGGERSVEKRGGKWMEWREERRDRIVFFKKENYCLRPVGLMWHCHLCEKCPAYGVCDLQMNHLIHINDPNLHFDGTMTQLTQRNKFNDLPFILLFFLSFLTRKFVSFLWWGWVQMCLGVIVLIVVYI